VEALLGAEMSYHERRNGTATLIGKRQSLDTTNHYKLKIGRLPRKTGVFGATRLP